jgi:N-acyl-D-aspartate/D-glutamate deacylase
MMTGADFPTRCLGELVHKRGAFTLEELVHRFTDVPARLYGIKDRGRIEGGYWADLVLFEPEKIGTTPLSTVHDLPAGAPRLTTRSTGVEHVIVAGHPVVRHGTLTAEMPGRLLRSGRDTETVRARGPEAALS